ncbi:hypothetical protein OPIT5_24300 [Opitutaceae bacterium TAV5]|nr:hypothetical protein OPIT5_24300 [Opitutaceae bacterium TAV5]
MQLFQFEPIRAENGFRMEDYWVWDPSVIRGPDGRWHMFASRWPKWLPFHPGWLVRSEVVRAEAAKPEGPYTFKQVVLAARGPEYWDGCTTHNPTIRFFEGRYFLFYMGSTHPLKDVRSEEGERTLSIEDPRVIVARSMKRIGVAWADNLEGPWHRQDAPLLPTRPGTFYSFLTSNPAPWIHESGQVTMLFKARAWEGHTNGRMSIGVATAPGPLGPYSVIGDKPVFDGGSSREIEDPFLWQDASDGSGFRMVAKDMHGTWSANGVKGGGAYMCSKDALHWMPGMPRVAWRLEIPLAISGKKASESVQMTKMGNIERPFLLMDHNNGTRITHLCAAVSNGHDGWAGATATWNVIIPVRIADGSGLARRTRTPN